MEILFVFKKVVSIFFRPTGIVILLSVLGFLSWWWARRRVIRKARAAGDKSKIGKISPPLFSKLCFLCAPLLLYFFSIQPVSDWLVRQVEQSVPPFSEKSLVEAPSHIVVLAAGSRDPGLPVFSRLSYRALARVAGGVDLWKRYPESEMVFTGTPEETSAMRAVAEGLGVPSEKIWEETESRDTKDHAAFLREPLEGQSFLLVSSAVHLPRAWALFRGQGLDPVAAPVDYLAAPEGGSEFQWSKLTPKALFCFRSEIAMHEMLGLLWAWLRGQTG